MNADLTRWTVVRETSRSFPTEFVIRCITLHFVVGMEVTVGCPALIFATSTRQKKLGMGSAMVSHTTQLLVVSFD